MTVTWSVSDQVLLCATSFDRWSPALKRAKRENRLTNTKRLTENPIHVTSIGGATPPNRRVLGHKAFRLRENRRDALE